MLVAELHGKVSPAQPPNDRQEDVLTSHVFSIFRYIHSLRIPTLLLCAARNVEDSPLQLGPLEAVEVFFWPTWGLPRSQRRRELDVMLVLREKGGGLLALGVENKYRAGASDVEGDVEAAPGEGPVFTGKQLVDEYVGMQDGEWSPAACASALAPAPVTRRFLLYVTKHYEMPRRELKDALEILHRDRGESLAELGRRVYWLGWHAVHTLLHTLLMEELERKDPEYSLGERTFLEDVRQMLERRNLTEFHPYRDLEDVEEYKPLIFGTDPLYEDLEDVEEYTPLISAG
jgi:hypothetical protein